MGKLLQKNIGNPLQKISNSLFYNCDTLPHQKTLTRLGNTSHEKTAPYKAGLLLWKGYKMKKYIPLDFDEKGKVILGREKNTPTPNGTIPAIFIPNGSDENKQGLKSISISPTVTTEPAIDSLFPIYWEDLTDEEKEQQSKTIMLTTDTTLVDDTTYTVTVTPTADWYAADSEDYGGKGEPVTLTATVSAGHPLMVSAVASSATDPDVDEQIHVMLMINGQG